MANPNDKVNYTDPKTGKVVSSGQYIPDDNPDVVAKQEKREKAKETSKKLTNFLSPILTKKFKKKLKEEEVSEKPKLSTSKAMVERKINRKTKKMTASEGSFAKGGRAGYKGGKSVKENKEQVYHSKDGKSYLKSRVSEKIHKAIQKQKQDAYAPKSPRNEKMAKGGRAGYKGGGMSQRGLGRAFMKGGKV